MNRRGLVVVVSGPSGAGKSTLLKMVREMNSNVRISVSATTRSPRNGEIEGLNYFFKTIAEFQEMIDNDELIEWVEYCGNYYGTPKSMVEDLTRQGFDVILEIEVEGALNIKKRYPECVLIFILPPSYGELKRRIEERGTEKAEIMEKRLERAKYEIKHIEKYDYIVLNGSIDKAANDISSILHSEKLRVERNRDLLSGILE